ncbi:DUF2955 domain-containing protein [Vibrio sp. D404a]|uniref:DUF2955 domain-containing protein n=2 Tax=unclassified Vibrio TaxID=2614977 RepID=UPI002795C377|nr:DUF2955 domain-containing protein [Vibrio sp. D404a]
MSMLLSDSKLRYGLRVTLTPWLIFVLGLVVGWKLSFVGAVLTSLFILSPKPVPVQYAIKLIIVAYVYMIGAWYLSATTRFYPGATLLLVFIGVVLSYKILVVKKDILTVVMALLGALLIPLQMKSDPDIAWDLAIWLPHNLVIAWLVSSLAFYLLPADDSAQSSPKPDDNYCENRRWLRLSMAFLPFVAFSFITSSVSAFTLTYLAVQVTQFAASSNNNFDMIKGAMIGNIAGGLMAVLAYEVTVIAPFLPLLALVLLLGYALLAQQLLKGNALAATAMTAFTVVCGVSLGPIMDDAEGKIFVRLTQIAFAMAYIFVAMLVINKVLPDKECQQA